MSAMLVPGATFDVLKKGTSYIASRDVKVKCTSASDGADHDLHAVLDMCVGPCMVTMAQVRHSPYLGATRLRTLSARAVMTCNAPS